MKRTFAVIIAVSFAEFFSACSAFSQAEAPKLAPECADLAPLRAQLDRDEARLKDWAQLARYRDANAQLGPPPRSVSRVVFLGDSITDNWTRPAAGGFFPGKPYINRGISGQTTPQMLIRFRRDVIALEPRVVVILAGTNDIAGNTGPMTLDMIEGNLAAMAELARAHGIRVVFASVMPVSDYGQRADGTTISQTERRPPAQILELDAWIKEYAKDNRHAYLDYFSAMVDGKGFLRKELSDDGLHPNAAGYTIMAPLAEQAIAAALKRVR